MQTYAPLFQLLNTAIQQQQSALQQGSPKEMYEPMHYMMGLGGKRLRPLLTLVGCDLFETDPQQAIHAAMAIELFHNFSLIHDDILDQAPLRRGQATVHQKWNHPIALLSGDGMLVKAFESIAKSNPHHVPELLAILSKTGVEVCEGQQSDMNFETQAKVSVADYLQMITYKTAVLLGCSLQMGAICGGASKPNQQHVYEFGKHIGIAFQILDDVLDAYANDQKFGKRIGGDIVSNKKTFLLLKAFELADGEQSDKLYKALNTSIKDTDKIKQVKEVYDVLNVKALAIEEANVHTHTALAHLSELKASETKKNNLQQFAVHLLNREF